MNNFPTMTREIAIDIIRQWMQPDTPSLAGMLAWYQPDDDTTINLQFYVNLNIDINCKDYKYRYNDVKNKLLDYNDNLELPYDVTKVILRNVKKGKGYASEIFDVTTSPVFSMLDLEEQFLYRMGVMWVNSFANDLHNATSSLFRGIAASYVRWADYGNYEGLTGGEGYIDELVECDNFPVLLNQWGYIEDNQNDEMYYYINRWNEEHSELIEWLKENKYDDIFNFRHYDGECFAWLAASIEEVIKSYKNKTLTFNGIPEFNFTPNPDTLEFFQLINNQVLTGFEGL